MIGRFSRIAFLFALLVLALGMTLSERQMGFKVIWNEHVLHLGAFLVLSMLGAIGWPRFREGFLICLPVFGMFLEAAQTMIPSRSFSWLDAVMNGVGVGIGVTIASAIVALIARLEEDEALKAELRAHAGTDSSIKLPSGSRQ